MGLRSILKKMKEREKEVRVLMLGLDNAGKTTILRNLMGEELTTIAPTLGFNIKSLDFNDLSLNIWDVGGQKSLRSYWRNYFEKTDAIVWVVDCTDKRRLSDCQKELHKLLVEERLIGATLLVFANKQDLPGALNSDQICEILCLEEIKTHHWTVMSCSAMTGMNLSHGMNWMTEDIKSRVFTLD